MLSVFITPWTKPTRIQCATMRAVRSQTCANHSARTARIAGCRRRHQFGEIAADREVDQLLAAARTSPRDAGSSKLPKRMNDGATRQTIAPGSGADGRRRTCRA